MQTFTRFGPYEIVEQIGQGGMGVVYRAHDTRLNRDVALKVIAESYLSGGTPTVASHERFLREARSSSALNHPNICTIYDVGEQDGRPYLVMELLEGQTLKQIIYGHSLPIDQVLDHGIQLASALAEAHERGILHRDIKPANLFVVRRGQGNGVLKVLDFGLAKHAVVGRDSSATNSIGNLTGVDGTLTKSGSTMGTVAYMAPEQARGEVLDGRADVFSAGVVMYEMATGSAPFYGQSVAEIFAALLAREPDPIRKRLPQFPKELERVILKCLSKEKTQRYASAAELLAELERVRFELLGRTGGTMSAAMLEVVERRRNYRRWLVACLAVVLLGAGAYFGVRRWRAEKPTQLAQADSIIVSEFTNQTGDPVFGVALKQALIFQLQQSPFLNVVSESHLRGSLSYLNKPADQAITPAIAREIAEREGDKAVINGTISAIGNQYLITLEAQNAATGDVIARKQKQADGKDKVLDALHEASAELREELGESLASIQRLDVPRNEATTSSLEAFRNYALGQEQQAQANFRESIPFYKRAIELDQNFAMAYAGLGEAYVVLGNETEGNAAITRAFELSGKVSVSERERLLIRARYYMNVTGDLPQAIETLQLYRETYPNDPAVPSQLSVAYLTLGQFAKAYDEVKETLKLNAKSGPAHVNAILSLTALNRFDQAKTMFNEAQMLNLADDASVRGMWIYTAYLTGDQASVQQQVEWAHGEPDGFIINSQMALIHENEGRFAAASQDWQTAITRMTDQKLVNATATIITQETLDRALVGSCDDAVSRLEQSLKLDQERTMQGSAAIAFALCGQPARANVIRQSLARDYPQDTIINHVFLPDIDAAIALSSNHADDALSALAPATDYDILGIGSYLRGLAHLQLKKGAEAAADFNFAVTHRSVFVLCQVQGMNVAYPLSLLGLARAEALENDVPKARKQYQAFFDYWKTADSDLPPLAAAHGEAARLGL